MKRPLAHLRCSTDKQDTDFAAQRASILAYAQAEGLTIAPEDWHEEVAVSGACRVRPVLERIKDACEREEVSHILYADFDRCGRSGFRTCATVEDLVEDYKVTVVFARERLVLKDPIEFRDRAIMAALSIGGMAKLESVSLSTSASAVSDKSGVTVSVRHGKRWGRPGAFFAPQVYAEIQAARAKGWTWKRIAGAFTACRRRWVADPPLKDGTPSDSGRWEIVNSIALDAKGARLAFRRTTP